MKSFEERLELESTGWVDDGIVTAGQRQQLLARHPAKAGAGNRFLAILASVGGVLLAVGISLVIKANWERIGDWVKIVGLLALLGGFSAAGWRLKIAPGRWPRIGDACLMVGAVCFFLGIVLVSQIFHLDSRPANGVLLWWVGIAALPWLTRARGAQFVSVVAGLVWLGLEFGAKDSWIRLVAHSGNSEDVYLFAAAGVAVGLSLTFAGLSLRGGSRDDFAGLHEKSGLILACLSLYVLGYTWSTDNMWFWATMPTAGGPAIALLGLLLLGSLAVAWARNAADVKRLIWFFPAALLPVVGHLGSIDLLDSGWLFGGLASVALFVLNVGMIRAGVATGREGWINLGVAFVALNIVTRYFLLFGTMLEGGVFFIVTGLLILGLGWFLELQRRSLVGRVRKEVAS